MELQRIYTVQEMSIFRVWAQILLIADVDLEDSEAHYLSAKTVLVFVLRLEQPQIQTQFLLI